MLGKSVKTKILVEDHMHMIEVEISIAKNHKGYLTLGRTQSGPTVAYLQGDVRKGFILTKEETAKMRKDCIREEIWKSLGFESSKTPALVSKP